jgi:DNA-binding GntR family transcriptional regulator
VPNQRDAQPTPTLAPLEARPTTLTDQVVAAIRKAVHSGELIPGQLYSAYQISDLLGVSRAPVREALMRLSEAGLVRMERNRGFRLVTPDAREIVEIFHLRLLLEVPAARVAAERRTAVRSRSLRQFLTQMRRAAREHDEARFMLHDREFHECLLRAGGNQRLVETVGGLRDTIRLLGASTVDQSRSLADIADEHAPIAAAVADGDPDEAARLMAFHVGHTGRLLVAQALRADGDAADPDILWREVVGEDADR